MLKRNIGLINTVMSYRNIKPQTNHNDAALLLVSGFSITSLDGWKECEIQPLWGPWFKKNEAEALRRPLFISSFSSIPLSLSLSTSVLDYFWCCVWFMFLSKNKRGVPCLWRDAAYRVSHCHSTGEFLKSPACGDDRTAEEEHETAALNQMTQWEAVQPEK